MNRPLIVDPASDVVSSDTLLDVDRAIGEIRRGGRVALRVEGQVVALILAAEAVTPHNLPCFVREGTGDIGLAISGRRAQALGLAVSAPVILVSTTGAMTVQQIHGLADPLQSRVTGFRGGLRSATTPPPDWLAATVALIKAARLLPVAVVMSAAACPPGCLSVESDAVLAYHKNSALALRRVAEARVPLAETEDCRVVAFRPVDGGVEHLALIIGHPDRAAPVLTRLHSECFTGDLLGSLRCDCGDQLKGAISLLVQQGGGVLLYLAQEGRGIGLVNKLRAYTLQDDGFDTLDANLQLGFDDDERVYLPAVEILKLLGIGAVRLLTNNPAKVDGLIRYGIVVTERVPHVIRSNDHNHRYLATKASRSGHIL